MQNELEKDWGKAWREVAFVMLALSGCAAFLTWDMSPENSFRIVGGWIFCVLVGILLSAAKLNNYTVSVSEEGIKPPIVRATKGKELIAWEDIDDVQIHYSFRVDIIRGRQIILVFPHIFRHPEKFKALYEQKMKSRWLAENSPDGIKGPRSQ